MKRSIVYLVASLATIAEAEKISVLGAGVFDATAYGRNACSGSDPTILGTCPGVQPGLSYGSCCVSIPHRVTVVMGCAPLISASDSCDQVAARLAADSTPQLTPRPTSPTPTVTPLPTTSVPSTTAEEPISTDAPEEATSDREDSESDSDSTLSNSAANGAVATNIPATTPADATTAVPAPTGSDDNTDPPVTTQDAATTAVPTSSIAPTSIAPTTSTPSNSTPSATVNILSQKMSDAESPGGTSADNSSKPGVTAISGILIAVAGVVIVAGAILVRKPKQAAEPLSTPAQPASMMAGAPYSEETPCNDEEDLLTPKEDLVCL
ncbi:unnamed protein product [Aphanomyces euteiches]|uniref:Uncharacterized protein n=1 Tax=Aphanomyces euteiches TaxID=100861 RepID=A0A6G0WX96_9STRA|nr:hypothetical protein Ae201684_010766 [Aphanomyces euteiches]KAH9061487.1 hypothetical protein Ae201684P_020823 [Aphanomyces euteiches]KAH9155003.1 hypothetical protein AeRB84_002992 [Aphanomyces euteiches]